MASESTDNSPDVGWACGLGCVGVVVVGGIGIGLLYWFFTNAFFYYPSAAWGVALSISLFAVGSFAGAFGGAALFEHGIFGVIARRRMEILGPVFVGFGVLCLGTVIGMSMRSGFYENGVATAWETPKGEAVRTEVGEEVPTDSLGLLGPIRIPEDNLQVGVRVQQEIEEGIGDTFSRWNFITLALLDENKNYLLSFGGDVWNYAGSSGGDHWQEEETSYRTTLEFPSAGTYYIRIRGESSRGVEGDDMEPIHVELYERATWGNPAPLRWMAYLAFFFGAICVVSPRFGTSALVKQHIEDGGKIRYDGQTWQVGNDLSCTYKDWMATEWSLQPLDPGAKVPRYLEHEYEIDSNWENWLISRPVQLDDLRCEGPEGTEMSVQQYVERRGELPDAVVAEGQRYALDDEGTVQREETAIRYRNYAGDGDDFVTIEGTPGESLEAVVGGGIDLSELSVVVEE